MFFFGGALRPWCTKEVAFFSDLDRFCPYRSGAGLSARLDRA
jgi:hypothetical protein